MRVVLCASIPVLAAAHSDLFPINPVLGVPGFPDCKRAHPQLELNVEEAADDLICMQKDAPGAIRIGMIGDSITAGVCSSGGSHPYPQQLQILLDQAYGEGVYSVTNLGACGATMLKKGDSPYWKRSQFNTLTSSKWDIITIMLGTNDAKDPDDHGPNNWQHDCSGPAAHTDGCSFAEDYKDMVDLVRTLGTTAGVAPKVYGVIPPALMEQFAYGMNQTVINSVFPDLVPLIAKDNKLDGTIDVFSGMGGVSNWHDQFPHKCTKVPTPPPPPETDPVGTTRNGTCGATAYGRDCDVKPTGAWRPASENITDLASCVARAEKCKMADYVSFSDVKGNEDCSWYSASACDFHHLCEDCSKCGIGCPRYYPYQSELLRVPAPTPPTPPPPYFTPCAYWCDDQHCDQCHPNDVGYSHLATVVQKGLGLMGPSVII